MTNSTFYEFYISPGVIRLLSPLRFASDLTVAGHTAPGDGIVIYGNNVSFSGADTSSAATCASAWERTDRAARTQQASPTGRT